MKKYLCMLVSLMVLFSVLLSGCNTTQDTTQGTTQETTDSSLSAPGSYPIVKTPVTFKVLYLDAPKEVEDFNTNDVTKWWENKTNVHIVWDIVTSDSNQKINLVMASGDLPDIISCKGSLTADQAYAYGSQKLIIPLNDLIDKYGVEAKRMFETEKEYNVEGLLTAPDGNIYFLPEYVNTEYTHTSCPQKFLINTKWLKDLNLKEPTTTDELYSVLKAFKENDANGNGVVGDEIPLAGANTFDRFLMNSFQYNSGKESNWLMVENGSILPCYTQPGWKDGLKYMRKLYQEGLVDKEIFLTKSSQLKMYTGDPKGNRLGSCINHVYSGFMDISTDVVKEFEFISPLKGPSGLQQTTSINYSCRPSFLITKSCKDPVVAFRWGDAFLKDYSSDDLSWMNGFEGSEGAGWERAKSGEKGFDGTTPAIIKELWVYGQPNNINWHCSQIARYATKEEVFWIATENDPNVFNQELVLYNATQKLYKPYALVKNVPTLMFEADKVNVISELRQTINTYMTESISKFVTGAMDIDNDWDKYTAELDKMGLKDYIKIYQEAYDK